jgi:hypothetical protein
VKKIFRWFYWCLAILGILTIAFRLTDSAVRKAHSLPALPSPNGYDEILAVALEIKPAKPDLTDLTEEQFRALADQNRPMLERARKAFKLESRVSVQTTHEWNDRHDDQLASMLRLAMAFGIEASVSMKDHHTNAAADCLMDMLRLADRVGKGGIITDGVKSLTIETLAIGELQPMCAYLDAEFCRKSALEIEAWLEIREKPETTFASERNWSAMRYGLIDVLGNWLMKKGNLKREEKYRSHYKDAVRRAQNLMLRLAAKAYSLDSQQLPTNAVVLIPNYLKALPKDYETGKEITVLPLLTQ